MFKKVIGCLVIGLVVVSSTAWAKNVELSFYYKNSFSVTELDSESTTLYFDEWDQDSSKEIAIDHFEGRESSDWAYAKLSYQFSMITLYTIGGIGRITTEINDPLFISTVTWYPRDIFRWEDKADDVKGRSELGFIVGGGLTFAFYESNGFQINFTAEAILQEQGRNEFILFQDTTSWYSQIDHGEYTKEIKVQRTKTQKISLSLFIAKEFERFGLAIGPIFVFSKTTFSGKAREDYSHIYYPRPEWNYSHKREYDFEFKTRNKNRFGVFTQIGYRLVEKAEVFIRLTAVSQYSLATGLSIIF